MIAVSSFMPSPPRPCLVITTYARPEALGRLLDDIEREVPPQGLDVRVYDDGTPNPDRALARRLAERGWSYRRSPVNHGKPGWWRWWNEILADLRESGAERFYVLQDDVRLCERFLDRSAALWSGIDDPSKASLYLHLTAERGNLGSRCWTPVRSEQVGDVVRCGWVDCAALMCDRRLFDALDWRLAQVGDERWRRDDRASSGVGQQISVRAHAAGLGLYRVARSLVAHDGGPSLMNAEARRRWSMDTVDFVDGEEAARQRTSRRPRVWASLASIPRRERGLQRVVGALLAQVDGLGVYLNGYDRVPEFLDDDRIEVARSQDHGERADAGKFFWARRRASGYHIVCDDDIDYPVDYVARLVEGIERHGRRAVVGFHGRVLHGEIADYHRSSRLLHFASGLLSDRSVHVLGTGVCGYHASAIAVSPKDFAAPNTADIWFALLGQRQRVPFVCLAHAEGWLRELDGFRKDSIYARTRRNVGIAGAGMSAETVAVREYGRWSLHSPPGASERPRRPPRRAPPPRVRRAPAPRRPPTRRLLRVGVTGPEHQATLVLPERDHITEAIRRSATYYERDLLDAIRSRVGGGTFVDVGAHYGNHTTFFAVECGAAEVVAIEPSPPAHAGLLETVAENRLDGRVAVHRIAAHPAWRRVSLTELPWRPRTQRPARSNSGRVGVAPATNGGDTPAAPLDEILDGVAGICLVKIDVEGLSAEILASGERVLRRDRPLVAAQAESGRQRCAVRALLSSLGYRELARPYCWTQTWLWEPQGREGRKRGT